MSLTARILWFSYQLDEAPLRASVEAAQAFSPEGTTFHVRDQSTAPLSEEMRRWLAERGVDYAQTTFDRRGNLNGRECILGEIGCFEEVCRSEQDVVIKVDCDTILLRPSILLGPFARDGNVLGAGCHCPNAPGAWWSTYAYRAEVLPALRVAMAGLCPTCRLAEDIQMSRWMLEARERTVTFWPSHDFKLYNFRTSEPIGEYVKRWGLLSFGYRSQLASLGLTPLQQRQKQAAIMRLAIAAERHRREGTLPIRQNVPVRPEFPGLLVDLGGHKGEGVTALAAKHRVGPGWRVVSWEPDRRSHRALTRALRRIAASTGAAVEVLPWAAWDADGQVPLDRRGWLNRQATNVMRPPSRSWRGKFVPCRRFAAWLQTARSGAAETIIKMDVEGAEYRILRDPAAAALAGATLYLEAHDRFTAPESPDWRSNEEALEVARLHCAVRWWH